MPWVKAVLRGQTVFARAKEDGSLLADGGRVEIRYKANDGRRYNAGEKNLVVLDKTVLPDETCGDASGVPGKGAVVSTTPGTATTPPIVELEPLPEGSPIAYTDGACTGNPGPAGVGIIIAHGESVWEISEYLGSGTNNIAELTAILRAVEAVEEEVPILIHTDSQYSIGVLSKGWKPKVNIDLIARIKKALEKHKGTQFKYVRGHSGIPLNERADELAREAVQRQANRKKQIK
jgi:ribonuclease HI